MTGGAGVGVSDGGHGGARHRGGTGLDTSSGTNQERRKYVCSGRILETIKLLPELSTSVVVCSCVHIRNLCITYTYRAKAH